MSPETKEAVTKAETEKQHWEEETLAKVLEKTPERRDRFEGVSLEPVERLYTDADSDHVEVGFPGEYPYKRGIHPTGYRGRLWTMRQFAGFSSPEETNRRFKYLMSQGQTGLSVAYDLPALWGSMQTHRFPRARSVNAVSLFHRLQILKSFLMVFPLTR